MTARWFLLLILLTPAVAHAATGSAAVDNFYVASATACPNNGDGLDPACAASPGASGAWSGLSNISWTATTGVDDGDTLWVMGTIPGTIAVSGTSTGTTGSHITIRSYSSNPGTVRTITNMTEALTALNWTNESANVWYLDVSSYTWKDPKRVWLDSVEVFPARTKAALGTTEGTGAPTARFFYDSATSRLYFYSASNPATTFSLFESLVAGAGTCAYSAICFNSNTNKFFDVIDMNLQGGNLATVYILGAENISFTGSATDDSACHIGGYGVWGMKITDTSVGGTGTPSANITVRDCTVDPLHPVTFTNMNWQDWGSSDGISLVNGTSGALITSNTVKNWGHVNINISATLGTLNTTDNVVSNNRLLCESSTEYCRGMAINGATAGRTTRNRVLGNTIDGQTVHSELNGDGNEVMGNTWKNARQCTISVVYDCTQIGQFLDMEGFTGVISLNNVIFNNTFQNNTYAPCMTFRVGLNTKSGFLVQNNRFLNCGGTSMTGYEYAALTLENGASVGNQNFVNNVFYTGSHAASAVYYKATGLTTVAGFQSACSGDKCSGNVALTGDVASNRSVRQQYIFQPVASSTFSSGNATPVSEGGVWAVDQSGSGSMGIDTGAVHATDRFSDSGARYIGTGFNANQYSRGNLTVSSTTGSGTGYGLEICASSSARTMYRFTADHAASNNASIYRYVAGTPGLVTAWTTPFVDADQFTFANVGETLYVFNASTLVKTIDDTGGGVGCASTRFPGLAHSSTTTSGSIDNWSGGNFRLAY